CQDILAIVKTFLYLCSTKEKNNNNPLSPTATRTSRIIMTKPITAERAIEAIQLCSVFMTDTMYAYQSITFPECVRISGTSIISDMDLEPLKSAGFLILIKPSLLENWGIDISIYDRK
ncbi:hypothetical protein ACR77V_12595, partial [Staphylococcus epidermidis]|uniref:hypothetical protein n=1 Tax=Staphylococcus epidermidis TaxID=1282 RepID=UPI003DA5F36A